MNNPTQLLPTDLIAVEVPNNNLQYKIKLLSENNEFEEETMLIFDTLDFVRLPQGKYEIIGEATETEISFDAIPYVKSLPNHFSFVRRDYKDYNFKRESMIESSYSLSSAKESFYSLLQANGLYWVNPYSPVILDNEEEQDDLSGVILALHNQWKEAESKVIKGKLIFLKPV